MSVSLAEDIKASPDKSSRQQFGACWAAVCSAKQLEKAKKERET
jgi:hypothetical protein